MINLCVIAVFEWILIIHFMWSFCVRIYVSIDIPSLSNFAVRENRAFKSQNIIPRTWSEMWDNVRDTRKLLVRALYHENVNTSHLNYSWNYVEWIMVLRKHKLYWTLRECKVLHLNTYLRYGWGLIRTKELVVDSERYCFILVSTDTEVVKLIIIRLGYHRSQVVETLET